jgi:succinoglycan biosynthesis protein ExoM
MLGRLLTDLQSLHTEACFTYSVIVVDSDGRESARDLVETIGRNSTIRITYAVATAAGIAHARNTAVLHSSGDLVAFIDDDERPTDRWLLNLYRTYETSNADGVLGPVKPVFEQTPPVWITRAGVFDRPSYRTGTVLHWDQTRTGNVLLRRSLFDDRANLFDPAFIHGEDKDFFRRMAGHGFTFVWCDEAPVYETETADRLTLKYSLKRALQRGGVSLRHHGFSSAAVLKAAVAATLYAVALPFLLLIGYPLFMAYLIKLCDHLGALLAAVRLDTGGYRKSEALIGLHPPAAWRDPLGRAPDPLSTAGAGAVAARRPRPVSRGGETFQ